MHLLVDESQDRASPSAGSGGSGAVLNKCWTGVRSHPESGGMGSVVGEHQAG